MNRGTIERYTVNPNSIQIPDEGLGKFIVGYTEENIHFNWSYALWNLFPIAGQIFFIYLFMQYWWTKTHANRILLYENGFIKQKLDGKRRVKKETVYNFNRLNGIHLGKIVHYSVTYGIKRYGGTSVKLTVLNENNVKKEILSGAYRNEYEVENQYNFLGYACHAVNNAWIKFAIQKFNHEFSTNGYATFYIPKGKVLVGSDFIKVNDTVVSSGFRYSFYNGYLKLYPNAAEGEHFKKRAKTVAINIAKMFNKEVFLMAMDQLHGVK